MQKLIIFFSFLICFLQTTGQTLNGKPTTKSKTKAERWSDFTNRLNLRQSFQGKLEKDEAAFFSLIFPKHDSSSQNLGVALGYNVFNPDNTDASLRPYLEWQKNTAADKKNDVRFAGFAFQGPLWNYPRVSLEHIWTPYGIAGLDYKDDRIKKTESIQANFYFMPVFKAIDNTAYPLPDVVIKNSTLLFYYDIYTGIEYENRVKTTNKSDQGEITRFYNRITANCYPLPHLLKERLEIISDYTTRVAMTDHSTAEKAHTQIFKLSVNLVVLTKETSKLGDVKIGYDYINGIDPIKSFDKQQLQSVTLKIKI